MSKVITADQAAALIKDGDTVAWTTIGMSYFAEEIAKSLEKRFVETGSPQGITPVHDCGCGDGKDAGMSHLAYPGLVKRLISGHTGQAPKMAQMVADNLIEAYLLPQGVLATLWRQIAGHKPGVITKVGMGTFVDPRISGGKVTDKTTEDLVKLIEIENEEWLLYKSFPVDVAIIRATTADENGNLTVEEEAQISEALPMAQAAHNTGGIVIAQVKYLAEAHSLHPKQVKIPGALVDYVVVAQPENHMQTITTLYNPALAGNTRAPLGAIPPMPFSERKLIARRAAMELRPNTLVNLGIGVPDGIASVAAEEGVVKQFTLTTELGTYGGIPASGGDFGAAWNADAIIDHHAQFDFYDGGGLDIAFLGLAQADTRGNLNVSKFGPKVVGPGGFINITQSAKKVVFCGTLTAGAKLEFSENGVKVLQEGKAKKFVEAVDQITFSGDIARQNGQPVVYVTERAVFELRDEGITLIEIAPGLDLERDVLAAMDFRPQIADDLREMPIELFQQSWGGLKQIMNADQ
ncbi:malonate decarboxylase subunit alpha [Marinobacterium sp. D7]|uniref:acyl CoA:acetate/3-ketoacid CoA transferase n=1 Tax=Marinobacterium ramblicola TaxID=2849041 RepID=UPI001C2DA2E4|nr:malonate decarboxylase subunit alpha [Marinobacterium ramblicola]MBV1789682.1 malonate decarboxylase subunit alpha [Marinobacterium ramblicola]